MLKTFRITVEAAWEAPHNEVAERELTPDLDKIFGEGDYTLIVEDTELIPDLSWLLDDDTPLLEHPSSVSDSMQEGSTARRARRHTRDQIIAILKDAAIAGKAGEGDVLRRCGVAPSTFRRWKAKLVEGEVRGPHRLKQAREEILLLKRAVAEQAIENQRLKELLGRE